MTDLLSKGQIVFTDKQAQEVLGISKGALLEPALAADSDFSPEPDE